METVSTRVIVEIQQLHNDETPPAGCAGLWVRNDNLCEYPQRTATYFLTNNISGETDQVELTATPDPQTGIDGETYSFEDPTVTVNAGYHFASGGTFSGDSLTGTFAGSDVTVIRSIGGTVVETFVETLGCTDSNAANYDSNANTDDGSCVFQFEYHFATSDTAACSAAVDGTSEVSLYSDQAIQPTFYSDAAGTMLAPVGWYTSDDGTGGDTVFRIGSNGMVAETAICANPNPPPSGATVTQFSSVYVTNDRTDVRLEFEGPSGKSHTIKWEGTGILFSRTLTSAQSLDELEYNNGLNVNSTVFLQPTAAGVYGITVTITDVDGQSTSTSFSITGTEVLAE